MVNINSLTEYCMAYKYFVSECTKLLPKLGDRHNCSGMTSQLLPLLVANESSKEKHIDYLIHKIELKCCRSFILSGCASLSPSQLMKKTIFTSALYANLVDNGMPVRLQDIDTAFREIPKQKLHLMKYLLDKYQCKESDRVMYDKIVEAARESDKKQFFTALKSSPAVKVYIRTTMLHAVKYY